MRSRGHEGERNNCFSKIQLVGEKNIEITHDFPKARLQSFFTAKTLQIWWALFATYSKWAMTCSLLVAQPIRMHH